MLSQIGEQGTESLGRIKVVQLLLALGVGITVAALIIGLMLSAINADYYTNPKAAQDAAQAGSSVLTQLGQVQAVEAWLVPFKFVGIATLFSAIALALSAIIKRIQLRGQVMAESLQHLLKPEQSGERS